MNALRNKLRALILVLGSQGLMGCEAMPALAQLAIAFGQDLIAAAAVNHAPRYATQVEALLIALANQGTGLSMQPVLAQSGYQAPPPSYLRPETGAEAYDDLGDYDDGEYRDGDYADTGYGDGDFGDETISDPSFDETVEPTQDGVYGDDGYDYGEEPDTLDDSSGDATYLDAQEAEVVADGVYPEIGLSEGGCATGGFDSCATDVDLFEDDAFEDDATYAIDDAFDEPAQDADISERRGSDPGDAAPIRVEAALLVRRAGSATLVAIDDGAVLEDGGSDPAAGDLLKVHVATNCACFLYVVGIDSTGYVAQIFPDEEEGLTNPVAPSTPLQMPRGDSFWALDAYKGVEQVYVLASRTPRPDVERLLSELAGVRKAVDKTDYQPVREPAIVPPTRGLVKVKARPVQVKVADSSHTIVPSLFTTQSPTREVVVTRWFHHR